MSISLKALVDKEKNKVVFVESDGDFIDVLLSFLTMPMGTIVRHTSWETPNTGIGCMNNLYLSVQNLETERFRNKACRLMLLQPRNAGASQCKGPKLQIEDIEPHTFFCCDSPDCTASGYKLLSYYGYFSDNNYVGDNCYPICGCGKNMSRSIDLFNKDDEDGGRAFVKELTRMIISDDLRILPPSTSTGFSLLSKQGIMDGSTIEDRTFNIQLDEVRNLLRCALVSNMPLTETFLKHNPSTVLSADEFDQRSFRELKLEEDVPIESGKIRVKLIVSKSKKMVCYAEAKEDFIDLLFSFLTIPLGFIGKELRRNNVSKGCVKQLYNSVQSCDSENYLKSKAHKAILDNPKLAYGFGYENQLLDVEEDMHRQYYYVLMGHDRWTFDERLTSDIEALLPSEKSFKVGIVDVIDPRSSSNKDKSGGAFVKGPAMFTVTDNLVITPISPVSGLSILSKFNLPCSDIEERTVYVGKEEVSKELDSDDI